MNAEEAVMNDSGRQIFYKVIPEKEAIKAHRRLIEQDRQSADLFIDVVQQLQEEMNLSRGASEALSRIIGVVAHGQSWDIALLRNNIFKAANALGMDLPSHMF